MSSGYATFFKVIAWVFLIAMITFGIISLATAGSAGLVLLLVYGLSGAVMFVTYNAISAAILQMISTHERVSELEYKMQRLPEETAKKVVELLKAHVSLKSEGGAS